MKTSSRFLVAALALACSSADPATSDEFYSKKTISLIVGGNPGGGYDLYARLLARHYPKHIPGEPTIVVQNMPGAGSINLANHLYNRAARDGTVIGMIFPGAVVGPLLDDKMEARFKPNEFAYLGSANVSTRVCVTFQTSKTRTFDDALARETLIGGDAPGGSLFDYAHFLRKEVGANFRIVRGYKGSVDITLAMERGEVEGICGFDWSSLRGQKPDWVRDKRMHVLLQVGLDAHPGLSAQGVPTLWSYVKDDEKRSVLELIVGQQVFGRPFMLPPGLAAERTEVLRRAFDATTADKDFIAEAERTGLEVTPATGKRVQDLVAKMYASPEAIVRRAKAALTP
jgi:tripartite-type tricarboxylate transporter receptor subunit TctC